MRMCTIELGLRDLPGKLRLESSLTLALPDSWNQATTTADSLAIAAVAGNLWVERASPCRLGVQVTISGGTLAEEARSEGRIVETIRRCSVSLSREPRAGPLSLAMMLNMRENECLGLGFAWYSTQPESEAVARNGRGRTSPRSSLLRQLQIESLWTPAVRLRGASPA